MTKNQGSVASLTLIRRFREGFETESEGSDQESHLKFLEIMSRTSKHTKQNCEYRCFVSRRDRSVRVWEKKISYPKIIVLVTSLLGVESPVASAKTRRRRVSQGERVAARGRDAGRRTGRVLQGRGRSCEEDSEGGGAKGTEQRHVCSLWTKSAAPSRKKGRAREKSRGFSL